MLVTLDPLDNTALKTDRILWGILLQGLWNTLENHWQETALLQGKTLPCEVQAIYQQHPGAVLTSVGASSSGLMQSGKVSTFQFLEMMDVSRYQLCAVNNLVGKKPVYSMWWNGCVTCSSMTGTFMLKGTHIAHCSYTAHSSRTKPSPVLHPSQQHGFTVKECRYETGLSAIQTYCIPLWKFVAHYEKQNMTIWKNTVLSWVKWLKKKHRKRLFAIIHF